MRKDQEKAWEELELKDDFMFSKIMRDQETCREMLERLLGFQIVKLEYPETQKTIDLTYDGKGVRLDIYVKDDQNTIYNVEIQTVNKDDLPKRSRYYQGMIDLNLIEKGALYKELNRSFVIFLCTFDLFGRGFYRYTFENICKEDTDIRLGDEAARIFFNTTGSQGRISEETKAFLQYIGGTPSEDAFVKKLQSQVDKARKNEEWRREYMTLLMRDREKKEEGRQEGLREGSNLEKERMARLLLLKNTFSDMELVDLTDLSYERIQEIKKELTSKS